MLLLTSPFPNKAGTFQQGCAKGLKKNKKVNKQRVACNKIIWFIRDGFLIFSVGSPTGLSPSWTPGFCARGHFLLPTWACLHEYRDALKSRPWRGKLRRRQGFPVQPTFSPSSELHSSVYKTTHLFYFLILFYYFFIQQVLIVIYFIHISVYMSIPISQFIPPPTPTPPLSPFVSICLFSTSVSVSALQTSSSVPFF